ncbi:MAG TPA: GntR family transcriptional regulator [Solirubrobacteraceae bacterium]|jgi:DNA-binding GntR family transcriptional regulator|nr:GntR family transcriptional regulator [Solirubrobacteraceae bacterium]
MRPLTTANLRGQAVEMLRASIVAGELEPGEIYSAPALAERLGVSATPVREAMLDLANDGLVEPVRNRGFRVVVVDEDALDEISELRQMLEVPAMAKVVARAGDEELAALFAKVDRIEAAAVQSDAAEFLLADRDFHLGLLILGGNMRLVRLVGQLRNQTRLAGIKVLADSGQLMASALEHRPILEAVCRREAELAQGLMRAHLAHTRELWAGRLPAGLAH